MSLHRSSIRYEPQPRPDEGPLTQEVIRIASQYGRYGYRRVTALLNDEGWSVSHSRIERIWKQEGLKVPQKQPKRRRLWLTEGNCIRLRPLWANHVWSWDFVMDRTHEGRPIKILVIIDEYSCRCLTIPVARTLNSEGVLSTLADIMTQHGVQDYIRSDNGAEMTTLAVRQWGLLGLVQRRCISSLAVPGRAATTNHPTAAY